MPAVAGGCCQSIFPSALLILRTQQWFRPSWRSQNVANRGRGQPDVMQFMAQHVHVGGRLKATV